MKLGTLALLPALALAFNALGADGVLPAEHPKNREFISRMIERLPVGEQETYRSACQSYDQTCPFWGFAYFGDGACEQLANGRSREQVLEGMAGFFPKSVDNALVDTAVEVICPNFADRGGVVKQAEPQQRLGDNAVPQTGIVGEWRMVKDDEAPEGTPLTEQLAFSADGKLVVTDSESTFRGQYSIEGDMLVYAFDIGGDTIVMRRRYRLDAEGLHVANERIGYAQYIRVK